MKLSIVFVMVALAANQLASVIGEPCNVNYEKVAIDGYVIKAFGVCEYKEEVEWQVEINTRLIELGNKVVVGVGHGAACIGDERNPNRLQPGTAMELVSEQYRNETYTSDLYHGRTCILTYCSDPEKFCTFELHATLTPDEVLFTKTVFIAFAGGGLAIIIGITALVRYTCFKRKEEKSHHQPTVALGQEAV